MASNSQLNKYSHFEINGYEIIDEHAVNFNYAFANGPKFSETLVFEDSLGDEKELAELLQLYSLVASTSYYKAYPTKKVEVAFSYGSATAKLLNALYREGLGEFVYKNRLKFSDLATFDAAEDMSTCEKTVQSSKDLVAIGGGKDSLVTIESLMGKKEIELFRVNSVDLIEAQADIAKLKLNRVKRIISPKLIELNKKNALNGHIPVTAIVSLIGVILSVNNGYGNLYLSSESSANIANLEYDGVSINHQFSKSEKAISLLNSAISEYGYKNKALNVLGELNEIEIAYMFTRMCVDKYSRAWNSSNQNFRIGENSATWDWLSPKTLSVFALMAPFLSKDKLIREFSIKEDFKPFKQSQDIWLELIGEKDFKPFECVASIDEMRSAIASINMSEWPDVKYLQDMIGEDFAEIPIFNQKELEKKLKI